MKKNYRDFVFDFYGTLADIRTDEESGALWKRMALYFSLKGMPYTEREIREGYHFLCRREEEKGEKELLRRGVLGPAEIDILKVWQGLARNKGKRLSEKEAREVSLFFRTLSLKRLGLYPGALSLLSALRAQGKGVYLLTNAQESFTRPELAHLGLADSFDAVFYSSDWGVKKPSPAFFGLLFQRGLDPENALMIGNDDTCDCRGASAAGMDSLYIHTAQSPTLLYSLPENCAEIASLREALRFSRPKNV